MATGTIGDVRPKETLEECVISVHADSGMVFEAAIRVNATFCRDNWNLQQLLKRMLHAQMTFAKAIEAIQKTEKWR